MHRRTCPAGDGFRMGGSVMVGLVENSSVECKDVLYVCTMHSIQVECM